MAVTAITIITNRATTNPMIRPVLLVGDGISAGSGVLSSVVGCVLSVRVVEGVGVGDGARVETGG